MSGLVDLQEILSAFSLGGILLFFLSNAVTATIWILITNWVTGRKESREEKTRFYNRLICVAFELRINFKDVGNSQNPFQTIALEKLVHEEPLIHQNPKLFEKASACLYTALTLSSSSQSSLKPSDGQSLMKELAELISNTYGIQVQDHGNRSYKATGDGLFSIFASKFRRRLFSCSFE